MLNKFLFTKHSLFSAIAVVQIVVATVACAGIYFRYLGEARSQRELSLRTLEKDFETSMGQRVNEILALSELGLESAYLEEVSQITRRYPIEDAKVIKAGVENDFVNGSTLNTNDWVFVPENVPPGQPRLALKVDFTRLPEGVLKRETILLTGGFALVTVFSSLLSLSALYFLVTLPLAKVVSSLKFEGQTRANSLSKILCYGEIKSFVDSLSLILQENTDLIKRAAIANTTQALAHDVRKPFSMFTTIIQSVEMAEPEEAIEILKYSLPEVNQAMASVEGMIQDVMQIGSDAKPHLEETSPETLIDASLGELFRVYPEADVSFEYSLKHKHNISVDTLRVGRVFSNILGNAVQAMGQRGSLWIHTKELEKFVEFTLGNAGSVIPKESLPRLFDAFFTSGKKGGTGLGLAIAKKIVEAHGGRIFCRSEITAEHPKGKVEFVFTLPSSAHLAVARSEPLPASSRELQAAVEAARSSARLGGGPDPRESDLEAEILSQTKGFAVRIPLLIVEDEAIYRNGVIALLEKNPSISAIFEVFSATNDTEALALAQERSPRLVIQDVDLGPASRNGIEIVRSLRASGFLGKICIHSNRFLMEDTKEALEAGADTVLPKPLSRVHFLKLLAASLTPRSEGA
jgi:signal transduction histidine kinase/CheY-like chemotaxis protein